MKIYSKINKLKTKIFNFRNKKNVNIYIINIEKINESENLKKEL